MSSGTNIVEGIHGGAAQFASGLGERVDLPNLFVFVTDGNDTNGTTDTDIENASIASGAEVLAMGIGSVDAATLDAIATDPNPDHVFYAVISLDCWRWLRASLTPCRMPHSPVDLRHRNHRATRGGTTLPRPADSRRRAAPPLVRLAPTCPSKCQLFPALLFCT